jgi:hypothetical protein
VSGQLHAPGALPLGKETRVTIVNEAGWAPEPVWTTWRRENSLSYRDSNSVPSVVQPVASRYTDDDNDDNDDDDDNNNNNNNNNNQNNALYVKYLRLQEI